MICENTSKSEPDLLWNVPNGIYTRMLRRELSYYIAYGCCPPNSTKEIKYANKCPDGHDRMGVVVLQYSIQNSPLLSVEKSTRSPSYITDATYPRLMLSHLSSAQFMEFSLENVMANFYCN